MKRAKQVSGFLLLVTLICGAWCSSVKGSLTQQTTTGLTSELNQKANQTGVPMNYFQVKTITFEQENKRVVGDQQQCELSFAYRCRVVAPANGYVEGDEFVGRARVLFVANEESDNWQMHWLKLE